MQEAKETDAEHPSEHNEGALGDIDNSGSIVDDVKTDTDKRIDASAAQSREHILGHLMGKGHLLHGSNTSRRSVLHDTPFPELPQGRIESTQKGCAVKEFLACKPRRQWNSFTFHPRKTPAERINFLTRNKFHY
ncbi:MAG: hypothetical protein ACE5NJ_09730, partial [Thermodesulfobacteriota bacterium]